MYTTYFHCYWRVITVCKNTGNTNQNIEMLTDGGVNGHIYWFVLLSDQKIFEWLYCNAQFQGKQYRLSIYTYTCIIWGSVTREN